MEQLLIDLGYRKDVLRNGYVKTYECFDVFISFRAFWAIFVENGAHYVPIKYDCTEQFIKQFDQLWNS